MHGEAVEWADGVTVSGVIDNKVIDGNKVGGKGALRLAVFGVRIPFDELDGISRKAIYRTR